MNSLRRLDQQDLSVRAWFDCVLDDTGWLSWAPVAILIPFRVNTHLGYPASSDCKPELHVESLDSEDFVKRCWKRMLSSKREERFWAEIELDVPGPLPDHVSPSQTSRILRTDSRLWGYTEHQPDSWLRANYDG